MSRFVLSALNCSGSANDPIDLTEDDDSSAKVMSSSSTSSAKVMSSSTTTSVTPQAKIDCSICWESIGTQLNPMWTAECGHVYCKTCIEKLTEKKKLNQCSVCRVKIKHAHQVFVYI